MAVMGSDMPKIAGVGLRSHARIGQFDVIAVPGLVSWMSFAALGLVTVWKDSVTDGA